jgi:hypothetical protein
MVSARWGVPGAGAHHLSESDQFEVGGSGGAAPHGERLEPLYWIIFPEGFPGVVFFLAAGGVRRGSPSAAGSGQNPLPGVPGGCGVGQRIPFRGRGQLLSTFPRRTVR